jgi:hypothetical protein
MYTITTKKFAFLDNNVSSLVIYMLMGGASMANFILAYLL